MSGNYDIFSFDLITKCIYTIAIFNNNECKLQTFNILEGIFGMKVTLFDLICCCVLNNKMFSVNLMLFGIVLYALFAFLVETLFQLQFHFPFLNNVIFVSISYMCTQHVS